MKTSAFNLCPNGHWHSSERCARCHGYSAVEVARALLGSTEYKFMGNVDDDRVFVEDGLKRKHFVYKVDIVNGIWPHNKNLPKPYFLIYTDANELVVSTNPVRRVRDLRGSIVWTKPFKSETEANREKQKLTGLKDLENYYG